MARRLIIATALAATVAVPAMAQGRGNARIPPGHMPPAGMCRVWIDGVPPGRQPAPTDCTTAERTRPHNARVIYGGQSTGSVWDRRISSTGRLDPLGRLIFRDALGNIVTRERTTDGWFIWRDASGNIIRRTPVDRRRGDDWLRDHDDDHNGLTKAERERLKSARKAEKERLKAARKAEKERRKADRRIERDLRSGF
jgi:hypothetical protein